MKVLFSVECQLAMKLKDERIMNGDQWKKRVYTIQVSHQSVHVNWYNLFNLYVLPFSSLIKTYAGVLGRLISCV